MNILLTGAAGQLGTELTGLLPAFGEVFATDRVRGTPKGVNWEKMDVGSVNALESLLDRVQPTLIVNAAAYTAVDLAETDRETAFEVNANFPGRLARWAEHHGASLIHYSTDYVFDGQASRPYQESDTPNPQNVYGESKLAGEHAVLQSRCRHAVLRTSWVYSSHGKNFVLSMLDLARRGISLKVVDDQRGCPTWAKNLALASVAVLRKWTVSAEQHNGLFHYCDDRTVSWHDFASDVFSMALEAGLLERYPELAPIPDTEFPQPATRPKWSVLDTRRITDVFEFQPVSYQQSLQAVVDEIAARG